MQDVLEHRTRSWDGPWIDLRHARFLRLSRGAAAAEEIEQALECAEAAIEETGLLGLNPELFAEYAALAELCGDTEAQTSWLQAEARELARLGDATPTQS